MLAKVQSSTQTQAPFPPKTDAKKVQFTQAPKWGAEAGVRSGSLAEGRGESRANRESRGGSARVRGQQSTGGRGNVNPFAVQQYSTAAGSNGTQAESDTPRPPKGKVEGYGQSPVNLDTSIAKNKPTMHTYVDYAPSPIAMTLNQYGIQQNIPEGQGGKAIINGEEFKLLQFHVHIRGEHPIDGRTFDGELHFVNQNIKTGRLTFIGVPLVEGNFNPEYEKFVKNAPAKVGGFNVNDKVYLNPMALLPHDLQSHMEYKGGLTIGPKGQKDYDEGVNWYFLETPVQVSKEQLAATGKLRKNNSRPVQPLGDREIVRDDADFLHRRPMPRGGYASAPNGD